MAAKAATMAAQEAPNNAGAEPDSVLSEERRLRQLAEAAVASEQAANAGLRLQPHVKTAALNEAKKELTSLHEQLRKYQEQPAAAKPQRAPDIVADTAHGSNDNQSKRKAALEARLHRVRVSSVSVNMASTAAVISKPRGDPPHRPGWKAEWSKDPNRPSWYLPAAC